ncbi:hypothetical protein B4O85_15155 [Pseudomonas azotoformans]|uniref:Uncharacterized protein n=1 Tax=Pseudomonas azotoformans TaxID=47878 RepID=A0A4Q0HVG4_PSEAZ|nr:hypothetical protein B4O85_15155 [Pseudomonas azotoformans]
MSLWNGAEHFLLMQLEHVGIIKSELCEDSFRGRKKMQCSSKLPAIKAAYTRALGRFTRDRINSG